MFPRKPQPGVTAEDVRLDLNTAPGRLLSQPGRPRWDDRKSKGPAFSKVEQAVRAKSPVLSENGRWAGIKQDKKPVEERPRPVEKLSKTARGNFISIVTIPGEQRPPKRKRSSEKGSDVTDGEEEVMGNWIKYHEASGTVYECRFCRKRFNVSQALGGHMNSHRREREVEKLRAEMPGRLAVTPNSSPFPSWLGTNICTLSQTSSGQLTATAPTSSASSSLTSPCSPLFSPTTPPTSLPYNNPLMQPAALLAAAQQQQQLMLLQRSNPATANLLARFGSNQAPLLALSGYLGGGQGLNQGWQGGSSLLSQLPAAQFTNQYGGVYGGLFSPGMGWNKKPSGMANDHPSTSGSSPELQPSNSQSELPTGWFSLQQGHRVKQEQRPPSDFELLPQDGPHQGSLGALQPPPRLGMSLPGPGPGPDHALSNDSPPLNFWSPSLSDNVGDIGDVFGSLQSPRTAPETPRDRPFPYKLFSPRPVELGRLPQSGEGGHTERWQSLALGPLEDSVTNDSSRSCNDWFQAWQQNCRDG